MASDRGSGEVGGSARVFDADNNAPNELPAHAGRKRPVSRSPDARSGELGSGHSSLFGAEGFAPVAHAQSSCVRRILRPLSYDGRAEAAWRIGQLT